MSRFAPKGVSIALLVGFTLGLPLIAAPEVQILQVGEWHGDEVGATSGGDWHCLARTAAGLELRPCTVEVATVFDSVVQANTGKKVSVPGLDEVVFLLRGAEGLMPGPVLTVFFGHYPFERGATLPLGGPDDRIWLSAEPAGQGLDVRLEESDVSQVLARDLGHDTDASPSLLWAGDLDRDGRLDLLLDTTDHYNVTERVLFLSRGAAEGALVRRAAVFRTIGC